jgi:hypothetical protein
MSLEDIRSRNKDGKLDKFLKAAGKTSLGKKRNNNDQEETYYPERDKNGNGSCIIRFLPGLDSEDNPYFVERFQHGFRHNNKWFIEFCPTTIDKECPVCEDNFDIVDEYGSWDECPPDVQKILRARSRTNGYRAGNYCNILVIKDPANPENEGKVHLFKFGKAILNDILDMAQPVDNGLGETPEPVDVFDLMEGANYKFIINKKDGMANYSKSEFEKPSKCPDFDLESQHPLLPLVDEKLFKSYDELSERFQNVVKRRNKKVTETAEDAVSKQTSSGSTSAASSSASLDEHTNSKGVFENKAEDDNMEYFKSIAEDIEI